MEELPEESIFVSENRATIPAARGPLVNTSGRALARSYRSKYVQHIWEGTSTLFYFKSALTNYFDVVQEQGGQEVVQEQGEQEVLQVQGEQEVVQLVEQEVVAKENKYKKSISQHKELQAMKNE
jgi:hypothetical protein